MKKFLFLGTLFFICGSNTAIAADTPPSPFVSMKRVTGDLLPGFLAPVSVEIVNNTATLFLLQECKPSHGGIDKAAPPESQIFPGTKSQFRVGAKDRGGTQGTAIYLDPKTSLTISIGWSCSLVEFSIVKGNFTISDPSKMTISLNPTTGYGSKGESSLIFTLDPVKFEAKKEEEKKDPASGVEIKPGSEEAILAALKEAGWL